MNTKKILGKEAADPKVLVFRHEAKKSIRSYFDNQGFVEIDTPYLLDANTPDPNIDPLWVKRLHGPDLQLHTSPEIWLKKALALGLPKIYQMGKVFRDDPPSNTHNIEFTMLEWYRASATLEDLIGDCEKIFPIAYLAGKDRVEMRSPKKLRFIHTDVDTLFWEYAGIQLSFVLNQIKNGSVNALQDLLEREKGDHLPREASFGDAFFHVMLKYVEPNLPMDNPVVIKKWPAQLAALAAPNAHDPNYCDRFEIYLSGVEIANAYQECTDPNILRSRFIRENCDRQKLNKPIFTIDEEFLESIAKMPPSAGIAVGFDRLLLALSGFKTIKKVIFGCRDH